jgi:hypothetical protein
MAKTKPDFVRNNSVRKEKRIMVRIPERSMIQIKKLMNQYQLKGIQALFDILIISGIVFRRVEIIEFIRSHKEKYLEVYKQQNLARMGLAEKIEPEKMYGVNMFMYTSDFVAFKNYVIEENIKQQWVWSILFEDGFSKEEPCIIDLINRSKQLDISGRKKAIARLSKDEYVSVLSPDVANKILDQLTEEYDESKFDDSIEAAIESRLKLKEKEKEAEEEAEIDMELTNKIREVRLSRGRQMSNISKPVLDNE